MGVDGASSSVCKAGPIHQYGQSGGLLPVTHDVVQPRPG